MTAYPGGVAYRNQLSSLAVCQSSVSDKTFSEAKTIFGESAVVDLIGSVGYFSMLQICLNSAEVDLQAGRKAPFANVSGYSKTA